MGFSFREIKSIENIGELISSINQMINHEFEVIPIIDVRMIKDRGIFISNI